MAQDKQFVSCSLPIRQLIAVTQKRVQSCLSEIRNTDLQIKLQSDRNEHEQNLIHLENLSYILENLIKRLSSGVESLKEQNSQWFQLLKQLPQDQLREESHIYQEWTWGDGNFLDNLSLSEDVMNNLESKQKEVKDLLKQLQNRNNQDSVTTASTLNNVTDPLPSINLPKFQLPIFYGDPQRWMEYWDSFESAIHSQNIPSVQKFNYLLSTLKGSAYKAIEGISVTNANYHDAIDILKKRFGDPTVIKRYLYNELRKVPISSNRTPDLRNTLESVERICRQLKALGEDLNHPTLTMLVMEKLPSSLLVELGRNKSPSETWDMEDLLCSLSSLISLREEAYQISYNTNHLRESERRMEHHPFIRSEAKATVDSFPALASFQTRKSPNHVPTNSYKLNKSIKCAFCQNCHFSDQCSMYDTLQARKKRIQQQKLCFRCLKAGHIVTNCQATRPCFYCQGNHNRALCNQSSITSIEDSIQIQPTVTQESKEESREVCNPVQSVIFTRPEPNIESSETMSNMTVGHMNQYSVRVSLMVAKLKIRKKNSDSDLIEAFAFFDSGSMRSYITNNLADRLGLITEAKENLRILTFGSQEPKHFRSKTVTFDIILDDDTHYYIQASSIPYLTSNLSFSSLGKFDAIEMLLNNFSEQDIPDYFVPGKPIQPDILIGIDHFWNFIKGPIIQLPSGLFMIPTSVGIIFSGKQLIEPTQVSSEKSNRKRALNLKGSFSAGELCTSTSDLDQFWNLETLGITDNPIIKDDDIALQKFNQCVIFKDKRYEVKWPWKSNNPNLNSNYGLCTGRLKTLIKRFLTEPLLLEKYDEIIQDQLSKGIIEKAIDDRSHLKHYLPLHPVITPHKTTTKVRIVYDASARNHKNEKSLNDCLYRGPILLPDLCGLLLRFRTYPIVILADIEKAFLQIALQPEDREVTRFLWLKDPSKPHIDNNIQIYRFCRVPFGVISSPFLLNATIRYHLSKNNLHGEFNYLIENLYVDNLIFGAENLQEAISRYHTLKTIFLDASMNLREWSSNDENFLEQIDPNDKLYKDETKVLGLTWNRKCDIIQLSTISFDAIENLTKRNILKQLASVFDPLGFLTPLLLRIKIFLQKLWLQKVSWDEILSQELEYEWKSIQLDCTLNQSLSVSRFLGIAAGNEYHLITFSDASKFSYATAVYLKVINQSTSQVNLIFAKSRLAPVKEITIPRLELLGAVIGLRALTFVENHLKIPIRSKTILIDSNIVLSWIYSTKPKSIFIENRIKLFRAMDEVSVFHVPGSENPADLATRGLSRVEIASSTMWWKGPSWLNRSSDQWPITKFASDALMPNNTEDNSETLAMIDDNPDPYVPLFNLSRYSSLVKALHIVVYVLRFIRLKFFQFHWDIKPHLTYLLKIQVSGPITVDEIHIAEKLLTKQSQKAFYSDLLTEHAEIDKKSKFRYLGIKLDTDNILRCYGRLQNANIQNDSKFPILLPRHSPFTELIILDRYKKVMHFGTNHTLSEIRRNYWIPKGRIEVRRILNKCFICKKYNSGPYQLPKMPPHPQERVTRSRPFQFIGLDYLGPLTVKNPVDKMKIWICIFTCLSTRAIHLEHIIDFSTQTFLNAFKRFIARRGKPDRVISDNASQFKLAKQVLDNVWTDIIHDEPVNLYFSISHIRWNFITEYAPWQGGFYERLVGLVKQSIRKSAGRQLLTFEQLITLLPEVEAVINSRPLTYPQDDIDVPYILRPVDLITPQAELGIPFNEVPEYDLSENTNLSTAQKLIQFWRKSQKVLDDFWKTWHEEYLSSLREKSQLFHQSPRIQSNIEPKLNEIVFIKDQDQPRGLWKLAKIVEIITSADNEVRSVKVELPNKAILKRSIAHIYPLEVTNENKNLGNIPDDEPQTSTVQSCFTHDHSKFKLKLPLLLTFIILLLPNLTVANKLKFSYICHKLNLKNVLYSQKCVRTGIVIQKTEDNGLCYSKLSCPFGHMNERGKCGKKCLCPLWSNDCSFFEGTVPQSIGSREQILTLSRPVVCSFISNSNCDPNPTHTTLSQIQLFDNSIHFVTDLHLTYSMPDKENYTCIGDGKTIGTPEFCEHHQCHPSGNRFCFYREHELVWFVNEDGQIPIKSWGVVPVTIYHAKSMKSSSEFLCTNCSLLCSKGGVAIKLDDHINLVEICSKPYCYKISHPKTLEIVQFPKDILIKPHEYHVKIWSQGLLARDFSISCPADPFCEMIDCYFCLDMLYNPQCAPRFIFLIMILCLYTILWIIYLLIKIIGTLLKACKISSFVLHKIFLCVKYIVYIQIMRSKRKPSDDKPKSSHLTTSFSLKPSVNKYALNIVSFVILKIIYSCDSCSEVSTLTASSSVCTSIGNGTNECVISEVVRLSLVPQGQESCLTIYNHQKEPLGTISIEVDKISLTCQTKNEYYTRSFMMHTESRKRCYMMGECAGDKCAGVMSTHRSQEISSEANSYPGFTYCAESCGCAACGCITCSSACLFYRTYAKPSTHIVFEMFSCPVWIFKIRSKVTINLQEESIEHYFDLRPGISTEWRNIKMTVPSISSPPVPILGSQFLTDGVKTVLIKASSSGQPISGTIGQLQCATREKAVNFDCYLPHDICSCLPQESTVSCTCTEQFLETLFDKKEHILPLMLHGLSISGRGSNLEAEYNHLTALELQLSMEGFHLTTTISKNKCVINPHSLEGCYNCLSGAKFTYSCSTDFGRALARISCTSTSFLSVCSEQEIIYTNVPNFNHALINDLCNVTCPGGESTFQLSATLAFINKKVLNEISNTITLSNKSSNGLDINFAIESVFLKNFLNVMIAATLTVIFLCLVCYLKSWFQVSRRMSDSVSLPHYKQF